MDFRFFFEFFCTFWVFLGFFLNFFNFLDFCIFWTFSIFSWIFFLDIFWFFGIPFRLLLKVTKVTTGDQKLPKIGQHSIISSFFCSKGKKSLVWSPLQELEVGPRSGPYLLVPKKEKKRSPPYPCSLVNKRPFLQGQKKKHIFFGTTGNKDMLPLSIMLKKVRAAKVFNFLLLQLLFLGTGRHGR